MTQLTLKFKYIMLYTDTLLLRARKTRALNKSKDANINKAITIFLLFLP